MQGRRGYLAGFGTMGVQVAAALVLLFVVSGLLVLGGGSSGPREGEPGALDVRGPERIAREAAPAAGAVAEEPAPAAPPGAQLSARAGPSPPVAAASGAQALVMAGDGDPTLGPDSLTDQLGPPPPPPRDRCALRLPVERALQCAVQSLDEVNASVVRSLVRGLNHTTMQLTGGAAQAVGELDPRLGHMVADISKKLCLDACTATNAGQR